MIKLAEEGFGRYVDKSEMEKDKIMDPRKCFSAFVKNDITEIEESFFRGLNDSDCNSETYERNYIKSMDLTMKKIAINYHSNKSLLVISPEMDPTDSKCLNLFHKVIKNYSLISLTL